MSAWIYWKSEPKLWTVGYYDPQGKKEPESDHHTQEEAAARVHYLNGGPSVAQEPGFTDWLERLQRRVDALQTLVTGWTDALEEKLDRRLNQLEAEVVKHISQRSKE